MNKQSSHDWKQFTAKSDICYHLAREGASIDSLKSHNLVKNGDREISRFQELATLYFGAIIPNGGKALDVCCGAGYTSECLRQAGFTVTGVDINVDAIAIAAKNYPENSFHVSDVTKLNVSGYGQFDLILIREAHPFSRIDDFKYQYGVINTYLKLLKPGGIVVIAHSRVGGGMYFPSLDFKKLSQACSVDGVKMAGPYFIFLMTKFNFPLNSKAVVNLLSVAASFFSRIFGLRLLEVVILRKNA